MLISALFSERILVRPCQGRQCVPLRIASHRPLKLGSLPTESVAIVRKAAGRRCVLKPVPAAATPTQHWSLVVDELEKKENKKTMVVQVAPAVRVAISEAFGLPPGAVKIGQIITGLRQLGFDYVFDTIFAADLTIMEEGHELLERLQQHLEGNPNKDAPMPMFTSCCPGWIAMVEKSYPDLIPYISTCKSPQMMMGAVIKNFFAKTTNVAPQNICAVSVMPCTRKQSEADRPWFNTTEVEGVRDVDHVVTTAELAKMFQDKGINLPELPESEMDDPISSGSGAGQLFGTTGGVMEAALRTVYEVVTEQPMPRLRLTEVRGLDGIKEAELVLKPSSNSVFAKFPAAQDDGLHVKIAVANGLGNAKKLVTSIKEGTAHYDFIEVMACPGGCISGGGQPRSKDKTITQQRQQAMYDIDERMTLRRCHDNPFIQTLYSKFLEAPLSHTAHDLLHTHYVAGGPPNDK